MPNYIYTPDNRVRKLVDEDSGEVLAEEVCHPEYNTGKQRIDTAIAELARQMKKAGQLFKTPWNHNTELASDASGTACPEIGLTNQSEANEADVNVIVKRVMAGGQPPLIDVPPRFLDVPDLDYQKAMDAINEGRLAFERLPQEAQDAYDGSPAVFLAHVEHCLAKGDLDPLRELGLAVPKPADPKPEPKEGRKVTPGGDPPGGQGDKAPKE